MELSLLLNILKLVQCLVSITYYVVSLILQACNKKRSVSRLSGTQKAHNGDEIIR